MIAVMRNGSVPEGFDDPKVTSLEQARRRKDAQARAAGSARVPSGEARSAREIVIGGLLVLAAVGMLAAIAGPLLGFNAFPAQ